MAKNKKKNKILVLAYSGGLDTSFCIPFLKDKGFDIHAVSINTGAFTKKDIKEMKGRALKLGAAYFESIDISKKYYQDCLRYLVFGNILRGNTYPLSVSSERAFQALTILDYVQKVKAKYVAHGSTGAGNDQIRFDIIFQSFAPKVKIITPIRDYGFSRADEVKFLKDRGFEWPQTKQDYSINKGLWGTSVGGKETLTSNTPLPEEAYPTAIQKNKPESIELSFRKGEVHKLNGKQMHPVQLIKDLEAIAAPFGIGRDTHVGNTIIGIKGRVGFEAAAALVIIKAHELLEKHTLTKWQAHWKKQLGDWYGMQLHEGQYMDPAMRDVEQFLTNSQRHVHGTVHITLYPRTFSLDGVSSKMDLMKAEFGSYGEENNAWTGDDAIGFTKILANPHRIYYAVHKKEM